MTIVIDQYKMLDIVTDGMTTMVTRTREAVTITMIGMIEITLPATIDEERSNGETMKTGAGKVTGTTDALKRNGILGKRILGSRQKNTNESWTEA